jgi:hypothetical protein
LLALLAPRRARSLDSGGSDRAAGSLDLAALMAGLAAVPERRATFQETRRFAALDQPLLSTGHLLYRRPGYLAKTTDWPQPESLVVDGGRLVLTAGNEAPRVLDLGGLPELRTLVDAIRGPLAGDLAALRRAFAVTAAGSPDAWTLGLVPLDPRAARLLQQAQVSGQGTDVAAVRLVQANGDEQQMAIRPLP